MVFPLVIGWALTLLGTGQLPRGLQLVPGSTYRMFGARPITALTMRVWLDPREAPVTIRLPGLRESSQARIRKEALLVSKNWSKMYGNTSDYAEIKIVGVDPDGTVYGEPMYAFTWGNGASAADRDKGVRRLWEELLYLGLAKADLRHNDRFPASLLPRLLKGEEAAKRSKVGMWKR